MAKISVCSADTPEARQLLESDEVTIGRGVDCEVVVSDRSVSRKHCLLRRTEQGYRIFDLDSRNPTRLNGEVVSRETLLKAGDVIRVGRVDILYVCDPGEFEESVPRHVPKRDAVLIDSSSEVGKDGVTPVTADELASFFTAHPAEQDTAGVNTAKPVPKMAVRMPVNKSKPSQKTLRNRMYAKIIVLLLFGIPFILFDIYAIWVLFFRDQE